MKHFLFILPLLLMAGCTATYDLEDKWSPLKQIVDRPGGDTWMTTIGSNVYLADLDAWIERNPPNSVSFNASMAHEHVHSIRQHRMGVTKFLAKYVSDQSFRWQEEQLGWYVAIQLYRNNGYQVNIEGIALTLASYTPKLGEPEDLLKWVQDVVYGRWKPAEGDLPEQYNDL